MDVTIFLITFNEEYILNFTLSFYRERFPSAEIIVYDNFSNDLTCMIAKKYGCKVLKYYSGNKMNDKALIDLKNNCWKNAKTDWVLIADADELLDICEDDLKIEKGSIIRTHYIQMVGTGQSYYTIYNGYEYPEESKFLCFDKSRIFEMNYDFGAHYAFPFGDVEFSKKIYKILHYKYISLDYVISRHQMIKKRMSAFNLKNKLSFHYLFSKRKIKKDYNFFLKNSKKIL